MIPRTRATLRGGRWFLATMQTLTTAHSDEGEATQTWGGSTTRWVQMTPITGRERYLAQQEDQEVDYRFRMRWESGFFGVQRRISYGGRVFHVIAAWDVDERNEWYEILAKEKISA